MKIKRKIVLVHCSRVHTKIKPQGLFVTQFANQSNILDDSTLHNAQSLKNNRASSINLGISRLKNWGFHNFVNLNAPDSNQ